MNQQPNHQREQALANLASRTFDLLVIGGGVTGCGIARDAALRGWSVALLEKTDIGAGTSSRSSKLIHGGLRYLEHGQLKLVFEGTNERALLLKRAPHLVRPLPFIFPSYRESRPGLLIMDIGLWMYDALSKFSSPKLHRAFRARLLQEMEPELRRDGLNGGILYYDCITDDGRLTLENALDAHALGATIATYTKARGLLRGEDGRIRGVEAEDAESGKQFPVYARMVINATGPWTDEIRAMAGESSILAPTKGIHLVVDAARLPVRHAVVMVSNKDKRISFAIPWGERTVIGTTDTFYHDSLDEVFADPDDAAYLLAITNHYFPHAHLEPSDVIATWAGLRPLIKPDSGLAGASDVSREHHIVERPGFITIAGGKLTTYRRMAAEVVNAAARQLEKHQKSQTAERSLPGADGIRGDLELNNLAETLESNGVRGRLAKHLVYLYGRRAQTVAARAFGGEADAAAACPLDPELPDIMAQVDEAVEIEMARTLSDVMWRRVPLLLRARDQGLAIAPQIAERMAKWLAWNETRVRAEIASYQVLVEKTRRFRNK